MQSAMQYNAVQMNTLQQWAVLIYMYIYICLYIYIYMYVYVYM